MKLSNKEIQERFKKLPENLREAIFSAEITETLLAIGKKYNLPVDKIGNLSTETSLVMIGATHPRDYIANLEKVLEIDRETAQKVAHEVNTQIFSKIRESLKKLHNIPEEKKPKPPSPEGSTAHRAIAEGSSAAAPPQKIPEAKKPKPYTLSQLEKPGGLEIPPIMQKTDMRRIDLTPLPKTEKERGERSSPFEEKMKEEIFRQKPAVSVKIQKESPLLSEKEHDKETETFIQETKKEMGSAEKSKSYPAGMSDPYQEQVDPKERSPKERAN